MSGHHANIEKWRREQSVIRTAKNRPDLLEKAELTEKKKAGKGNTKRRAAGYRVGSYKAERVQKTEKTL